MDMTTEASRINAAIGHLVQVAVQLSAYAVNQGATRYERPALSGFPLMLARRDQQLAVGTLLV
ncbi:hypothetical protein [Nitrosospira sp. Is2]|uniref:hypothetical protein n=1 Tax=Nitrosospira sp. Is2 TaxID=3080532 RepID=UPI002954BF84|nr:hypothetical protein [Nitrosospira sp. Is2]WON74632.1 hypothetical protein R5L00_03855 [Nitrosospira sp. Is2]